MARSFERISEATIEDAIVYNLDVLKDFLKTDKQIKLITRQLRLVSGEKRLDLLLLIGNEIHLIELKITPFFNKHISQIKEYAGELKKLQANNELIPGDIKQVLMVTGFSENDKALCLKEDVEIYSYSPQEILEKYFYKVSSLSNFINIKPVDLGVFNIKLIDRVLRIIEEGKYGNRQAYLEIGLEKSTVEHFIKFSEEFGLLTKKGNKHNLTEFGYNYISAGNHEVSGSEISEEQIELLREFITKDPFYSPIVFGIYSIIESVFLLSRNYYPISLNDLQNMFVTVSGKKHDWKARKSVSTATYTFLNYAITLGLLVKIGTQILITPVGFRFILMLQLHKSIKMIDSLIPLKENQ